MRRVASAVLSTCLIAFAALLAGPAHAGDYYRYDGGYSYHAHPHAGHVWYSSSCCYRRIVRHEARVRYVPVEHYGYERPYHYGLYERPYHDGYYGHHRYADYPYYRSYAVSSWRDAAYAEDCYARKVRVPDGGGGWVWGIKRVCD